MDSAIRRWIHSNSFQLCCRSGLYCRPFGSASVGAMAVAQKRKRSGQEIVVLADLLANVGSSHHAADNADTTRLRKNDPTIALYVAFCAESEATRPA